MAMKETVGSLRAYFAVAGAYSGWQGWQLYQAAAPLGELARVFVWIAILVMALSVAYLVLAATLPRLLSAAPIVPTAIVALNLLTIVGTYLYVRSQFGDTGVAGTAIGVVINVYLLFSLRRLTAPMPPAANA